MFFFTTLVFRKANNRIGNMKKSWLIACFSNFFIAALMGLLLRFLYLTPIDTVNFQFLLHGHSHVAMLGWLYLILYCLLVHFYIPKEQQNNAVLNRLFWITELAVIGMMVRFPVEGYALLSIVFSTLHIFCSYYFSYLIWKKAVFQSDQEKKLVRTALIFMIISTFGVWVLGPAVGMLGKASAFFQIAIQFFLHFQFNGWFLIAVLVLFLSQLSLKIPPAIFGKFYILLLIATVFTLALPVSWYLEDSVFYWINLFGVLLQAVAFYYLIKGVGSEFAVLFQKLPVLEKSIYIFTFVSLAVKIVIQLLTFIPEITVVSHQIRNFVIGFIHLNMLGIITGMVFIILIKIKLLPTHSLFAKTGIILFFASYLITEVILFSKGVFIYFGSPLLSQATPILFAASIGLPLSILCIISSIIKTKQSL